MYENLIETMLFCTKNGDCHNCPHEKPCVGESLYCEAAVAIEELNRKYTEERNAAVELTGELAAVAAKMPRWIPVTERMPEKYTHNLVYSNETGIEILYFGSRGLFQDYHSDEIKGITHWMPLPCPPEEDNP